MAIIRTLEIVVNGALFPRDSNETVLVKDIELDSLCEHRLLPFACRYQMANLLHGKVLGLSKLAWIVDMFARHLQVQEH